METTPGEQSSPEDIGDQVRAAMSRGDTATLALLVRDHSYQIWVEHTELLPLSLQRLTAADYANHPALVLMRELAGIDADPEVDVTEHLDLPGAMAELPRPQQTRLVFLQMNYARYRGEQQRALALAADLRVRLRQTRALGLSAPFDDDPLWLNQIAFAETLLGDTSHAVADLRESRRLASTDARDPTRRYTQSMLAVVLGLRGNVSEARAALAESRALPQPQPAPTELIGRLEETAAALIATEAMDPAAAELLAAAQRPASEVADELWPVLVLAEGRHALAHHNPAHVLELTATATATARRRFLEGTLTQDVLTSLTGRAFLDLGDLGAARRVLAVDHAGPFVRVARLRELIARGASRQLSADVRILLGDPRLPPVQRTEMMLLAAWGDWMQRGRVEAKHAALIAEQVLQNDLLRVLATVPRDLVEAVVEALPVDRQGVLAQRIADLPHWRAAAGVSPLTERERIVLTALNDEASVSALGRTLFLSPNTVKTHLRSVYRKLGVRSREEALDEAVRLGILRSPSAENRDS
jgi:ATP/maltotriose-dependent transcriptional regulator MalT